MLEPASVALCISLCLICICIYTYIHRNIGFCCLFLLLSFIPKAILFLPILCTFLSNFIIQIAFQDYILIQDFDAQEEFFLQLLILSISPYSPLCPFSLCLSLSPSASPSHQLHLCLHRCLSLSVSVSDSLSPSPILSLSLSPSHRLHFSLCLCLSLCLSLPLTISVSVSLHL